MPETSRRVNVTLTIPSDDATGDVLNAVLAALRRAPAFDNNLLPLDVESAHVHAFDLDEDDEPEPAVQLVVRDGGIYAVHVDDAETADAQARKVGGVVVTLPIETDHRRPEATDAR